MFVNEEKHTAQLKTSVGDGKEESGSEPPEKFLKQCLLL